MKFQYKNKTLTMYFAGDFDNVAVSKIQKEAVQLIDKYNPENVKLDFNEVQFIDSTGIGFVLARYKQLLLHNATLTVCNLSSLNQKIFKLSGIFQVIKYEGKEVVG